MKKTLIVIPAYNVEKALNQLLLSLNGYREYCLIVNDGSTDQTQTIIEHHCFPSITLSQNSGISKAVLTGIQYALRSGYENVLLMDADGQHNPKHVERFLSALEDHPFVFGNRFHTPGTIPSCKLVSNAFASAMYSTLANCHLPDVACGYKAFRISEELLEHLQHTTGYSVIYRLVNYALQHRQIPHFVPTDAIYYPDELLCTRASELVALIESAAVLAQQYRDSADLQVDFHRLLTNVRTKQDFSVELCSIRFYAFYIEAYDSYIMQAAISDLPAFYHR